MSQRCPHDGGYCHHLCATECWRKDNCGALTTPWPGFPKPGNAPIPDATEAVETVP